MTVVDTDHDCSASPQYQQWLGYSFVGASIIALVILFWMPLTLSLQGQVLLLLIPITLLGLPHGAMDAPIAAASGLCRTPVRAVLFHVGYLGLAGLVVAAWIAAPVLALAAFLLISAWHFGGDWDTDDQIIPRFAAGCALLSMPSILYADDVVALFVMLSGPQATGIVSVMPPLGALSIALLVRWYWLHRAGRTLSVLECAAALIPGLVLPPLWFFALYFCWLHSPRHLIAHWPQVRARLSRQTAILVLSAYTAGTVMVAVTASALIESVPIDGTAPLVRLLFIGLAALTVPHMALLFYLHWKKP